MNWDEWLPYAMFIYNTIPHTATAYIPFKVMYGHQATISTVFITTPKPTYVYDDYVQKERKTLRNESDGERKLK